MSYKGTVSYEQFESVMHLSNEDNWRHHPVQPMKRYLPGDKLVTGIVVAGVMAVYGINMMDLEDGTLRPQLERKEVERTDYGYYMAMALDGWLVD